MVQNRGPSHLLRSAFVFLLPSSLFPLPKVHCHLLNTRMPHLPSFCISRLHASRTSLQSLLLLQSSKSTCFMHVISNFDHPFMPTWTLSWTPTLLALIVICHGNFQNPSNPLAFVFCCPYPSFHPQLQSPPSSSLTLFGFCPHSLTCEKKTFLLS